MQKVFLNILFICNPGAIHDRKWISFFAGRNDIRLFATWEDAHRIEGTDACAFFQKNNIQILPAYSSFSLKRFHKTAGAINHLNALITAHHIDLVHILFAAPHALYVPFLKARCVITTRGSDVLKAIPDLKKSTGIQRLHDYALFYLFKRAFQKAALITCTSQKQVDKCTSLFSLPAAKCLLVRTGVDVEKIQALHADEYLPASLKGKKIIFSPRWMYPQYNVETQIAAIELLSKEILAEYTFVFIQGKDVFASQEPYFSQMRSRLDSVPGLQYQIFEKLNQQEVWACYKKTTVAFMVPLSDGTPSSGIEAMAARCKLIIGDADYDTELFKDTCIVVEKTDARQLAQAIKQAIEHYPEHLLNKAYQQATMHGNRTTEMNKLLAAYHKLFPH